MSLESMENKGKPVLSSLVASDFFSTVSTDQAKLLGRKIKEIFGGSPSTDLPTQTARQALEEGRENTTPPNRKIEKIKQSEESEESKKRAQISNEKTDSLFKHKLNPAFQAPQAPGDENEEAEPTLFYGPLLPPPPYPAPLAPGENEEAEPTLFYGPLLPPPPYPAPLAPTLTPTPAPPSEFSRTTESYASDDATPPTTTNLGHLFSLLEQANLNAKDVSPDKALKLLEHILKLCRTDTDKKRFFETLQGLREKGLIEQSTVDLLKSLANFSK